MIRTVNVSDGERIATSVAGALIAVQGFRQRSIRGAMMMASGAALIARGATGYCPAYAALDHDRTADSDRARTKAALGGSGGIRVEESVTINLPVESVYSLWRRLEDLPRYIPELKSVKTLDDKRSHWMVTGPAGRTAEWDAEIINEIPNQLIAWQTVGESDVISAGSVRFVPSKARRETQVHVKLQYDPPGGKGGSLLAWLMGKEPGQLIREGLRRMKAILEAGEAPTAEGQPRGRQSIFNYD